MLTLTARLAVKIKHLPDFEFDWADNTPQRPRASLKVEDFLPSEADAATLSRALHDGFSCGDILES